MRIGIMCLASLGGSASIATQLAIQLARRGHRVHLFARTIPFSILNQASGVQLHTVKTKRENKMHPARLDTDWSTNDFVKFLSNILDVIAVEGLDVLHFHYAVPLAFLTAEVKRRLGWTAPLLVGTLHGTDVSVYGQDPFKGFQLAQVLYEFDALTTVSESHADLAANIFGLPIRPIVIPNFVDLSKFRPLLAHSRKIKKNGEGHDQRNSHKQEKQINFSPKPRIAHLSNFRAIKDPQSVARIFLGIREQMEAELWLIGNGPEMDAVKSILRRGKFERDVRYWNLRRGVAGLLAQTDLLLMTSLTESFCLAALEAMACGVPVLATDVGGLPEVVVQGKTGFLFPPGDHEQAVQLAVNLLSDRAQRLAMSEAAVHHAAHFGEERIVPMYEHLYQDLLMGKSDSFHILPAYSVVGPYSNR
jgi:N-acetyl-alpha-D-glucosaminyl L-malate synthase BshA